jgi:hypothetical protein
MKGHTRAIRVAAFSPDGQKVATASRDTTARLWDAQTGRELHVLIAHSNVMRALAFSPDGTKLVTVAAEPVAHVWDTATGRQLFALKDQSSPLGRLAFSPDGRFLAAGSMGRSIRIWDAGTFQSLASWRTRAGIQALEFSPDGKRLVVVASDFTSEFVPPSIEIWDVETARLVLAMPGDSSIVLAAKFNPDGRLLGTTSVKGAARLREAFPWEEKFYPAGQSADRGSPDPQQIEHAGASKNLPSISPSQRAAAQESRGPGAPAPLLLERVQAYATEYWRTRLAAEDQARTSAATLLPPEPLRFPKSAWSARDANASRNLIDLSMHYNALLDVPWILLSHEAYLDNDLSNLSTGTLTLSNVLFDVRGLIRLDAITNTFFHGAIAIPYPVAVRDIQVGSKCRRIHVLHGAEDSVPDGTVICRYILHYADGSQHEIPVLYGRDVRAWWELDADINSQSDRGIVAWRGTNPAVAERGGQLRLYLSSFEIPRPDAEVKTIDLVSALTRCAPFLIALTIEP